jgi:adenylate cyclase
MQRKLTAILSADVVGYSALMGADEAGTLERLKANRGAIFDPHVAIHGGRVFKLLGDGALVEFSSVVAAVNCALAIQEATEKSAQDRSDEKRIRYRIGVNLGDVIVDGDDIYGDGVNVAARLQALAPVGGVALSKTVRENVEGKLSCVFEDMGEHSVKNIANPVHVFAVRTAAPGDREDRRVEEVRKLSICVLPFANMSGDVEQEYFSDGISEDIITDLSKVSALFVVARNTSFQFKGKSVDVPQIARQLKVNYILEGSVRKAAGRVRITAQLIDGRSGGHVWAERYDRNLNDIFALQDEISEAIVAALKLKLMPEERRAITHRGTDNVEAYNLLLMARRYFIAGNFGDPRQEEATIRLCSRATEIDRGYADAWSLLACAQMETRWRIGKGDGGLAAAEKALALDSNLAEAHAVRARILYEDGHPGEANSEIATALGLEPESWVVNSQAGMLSFRQHQLSDAARYFEKAAALMETDFGSPGMLITVYTALGDLGATRQAAQVALARTEKALVHDGSNGAAMGFGVNALAVLGESERAKEWIERALLIDPDNINARYNFACALAAQLKDSDAALDMLVLFFERAARGALNHAKADPDLESLRDHPRFKALFAAAEARLATEQSAHEPRT